MSTVRLFIGIIWIILVICAASSLGEDVDVCLDGCQMKPHIKCSISTIVSCDTIDRVAVGGSELWPSSPTALTAIPFGDTEDTLAINITWGLPDDVSYKELTGFVLRIKDFESFDAAKCVFFDLTGTNWDQEDLLNQFHYSCFPDVKYGRQYYIQIESVPFGPTPNIDHLIVHAPPHVANLADGMSWRSFITIKEQTYDNCSCSDVEVTFTFSPFKPHLYYVTLKNESLTRTKDIPHIVTKNSGIAVFHNVCEGIYTVRIEQTKKTALGECVCGDIDFMNCYSCPVAESPQVNVTSGLSCPESSERPLLTTTAMRHKSTTPKKDDMPLGVFVGLFAFAAIFLCVATVTSIYCIWTKHKGNSYEIEINNNTSIRSMSFDFEPPVNSENFKDNDTVDMHKQLKQQSLEAVTMNSHELGLQRTGISNGQPTDHSIGNRKVFVGECAF